MDKGTNGLASTTLGIPFETAWQRLIIMLGGVTVNFILAFIIYIGKWLFAYGDFLYMADMKDGLLIEKIRWWTKLVFQTGDKILSIDGEK